MAKFFRQLFELKGWAWGKDECFHSSIWPRLKDDLPRQHTIALTTKLGLLASSRSLPSRSFVQYESSSLVSPRTAYVSNQLRAMQPSCTYPCIQAIIPYEGSNAMLYICSIFATPD